MNSSKIKLPLFRSIHGRLLIYYLPLSLIPLIVVSFLAYSQSRNALRHAAGEKLEAVQAIKKYQIESYLTERESAAQATADLVNVLRQQAFDRLEALRDNKRNEIIHHFEDWQKDILDVSSNPDMIDRTAPLAAGFDALGADRVRELYLNRPHLEDAGDESDYSAAHAPQHRLLTNYLRTHEHEDILLIDPAGSVIYTAQKGSNFGLDLSKDTESSLGVLYQQLKAAQPGQTALVDVDLQDGQVVFFMGTPLFESNTRLGTLIFQLPFSQIDEIMRETGGSKLAGETYLVGPDKRMRSQSLLDSANRSVAASLMGSVEENGVDTPGSQAALTGLSGVDLQRNYLGDHVVSAYAPLEVPGLDWAILVEEEAAAAIVPQIEGTGMYLLTQYAQRYGYQDLILMANDGYVFHTVMRAPDYQTNLLTGPYRDTHLGRLVQEVLDTGELTFADFAPYLPAGNKPVAFVAAPVMYQDKPDMVLALQLPPGWTDKVMQERTGMGVTGETLLVGPDKRMRSNSFLDPAGHSVEASFVGPIEKNGMDTKAVREALTGKSGEGVQFDQDYLGNQVITTYAPVQFGRLTWALIAKQNVDEAFVLVDRLSLSLLLVIFVAATLVILVTLWTARRLADPILRLAGVAQAFANGDWQAGARLENSRSDELGILANSLKSMASQLRDLIYSLEEEVRKRTAELEAANKELEAFTYSVSHDLRAPLRAIDGYTRILVEDYDAFLDAEGKRICGIISSQVLRTGQLIDELLAFSRLGRAQMQSSLIDMEKSACMAIDELISLETRDRFEVVIEPLPPAIGDPAMLHQVWTNLLANAVKFSSERSCAVIEVGGQENDDEIIYFVRDNGAGFDMRYADKLFGVFQRLHSEREFEGTGVGLAIVQRVIHRHGGRVWAEGVPDQGATFYFTLPRKGNP